jgi:hypothetical protein
MNYYTDFKEDYTRQLTNVLTPLIYEGLQSIYKEALITSNKGNVVLRNFQLFLGKIIDWDVSKIENEKNRIINCTKCTDWIIDLIKSVIKINLIIQSYPYCDKTQKPEFLDEKYYKDLDINKFVHIVYIECARDLWNNPYLMYHGYESQVLTKNKIETISLINKCIQEGIRKMLPVKMILSNFLEKDICLFKETLSEVKPTQLNQRSEKFIDNVKNIKDTAKNSLKEEVKSSVDDKIDNILKGGSTNNKVHVKENDIILIKDKDKDNEIDTEQNIINLIKKSKAITDSKITTDKYTGITHSEKKKVVENNVNNNDSSESSESYVNGKLNDEQFEDIYSNTNNKVH